MFIIYLSKKRQKGVDVMEVADLSGSVPHAREGEREEPLSFAPQKSLCWFQPLSVATFAVDGSVMTREANGIQPSPSIIKIIQ